MTTGDPRARIVGITLDDRLVKWRSAQVEHERKVAIYDLLEENRFQPVGCAPGPYRVHLAIEDNRLVFHIRDETDGALGRVPLPLLPFRKIIKDYFQVCESYYDAIRSEEHTSELQSLMRISYAVFCLKKKQIKRINKHQQ